MKKEKKKVTKKKVNNGRKFPEKDKILNELASQLKSAKNSEEESETRPGEAELEKDVELNLNDLEFHSFMQSSDDVSAPVLERIAGRQPSPIFVGGISQSSNIIPGEEKESDPFKYMPGGNANNEPKYIDSDSHIRTAAEIVDFNKLGRAGFQPEINQENMFIQSPEARAESPSQERIWAAERVDFERERRKNPREREETKYEKYKPDLPKSR